MIDEDGDLGIGIGRDKAAAELVARIDANQPSIIFRAAVAQSQQLLQHHRDLDAVGRAQGIELQGMASDRQVLFVGRTRDRAVDIGELAAIVLVPGPDLRRHIGGLFGHG